MQKQQELLAIIDRKETCLDTSVGLDVLSLAPGLAINVYKIYIKLT